MSGAGDVAAGPAPVRANDDRFGRPFEFLDARFTIVLSSADTGGAATSVETVRRIRGGPPMHVHPEQDEWFFVREGEFDIRIGDATHHLYPGDSLLAPRGVPHAFANTTEQGRMLVTFLPAGAMEAFFHEASALRAPTPPELAKLFAVHGMQVVGPPLPVG